MFERLKEFNKIRFEINLSNRKYKMIVSELLLVLLIVVLSQIIAFYFPIEEPLREFGNDYWLYMLLALIEVVLIGLIFFVAGIWFTEWRSDRRARLSENLEMENLSPEKENDRNHSF